MTTNWCLLYRVTFSDGHVAECSGRSWAATAELAADNLRRQPLAGGAIAFEVVAILPWEAAHAEASTAELFAALRSAAT